jgi:hypothetical protein
MNHTRSARVCLLRFAFVAVLAAVMTFTACSSAASSPTATQTVKCPAPSPPTTSFHFAPSDNVTRDVTIEAPNQNGHPVNITTLPLPNDKPDPKTTQTKGNDFLMWIINPRVCDTVTQEDLVNFEPALTVTVLYRPEDAKNREDGKLSLLAAILKQNQWLYQILPTKQDPEKLTLTATLSTLEPKDSLGMGYP